MKITISFLVIILVLLFSIPIQGQSKSKEGISNLETSIKDYIRTIDKSINLSEKEEEQLYAIKKSNDIKSMNIEQKFKDHVRLNEERLKLNIEFSKSIVEKFGKKRGFEILEATKVLKASYFVNNINKNENKQSP